MAAVNGVAAAAQAAFPHARKQSARTTPFAQPPLPLKPNLHLASLTTPFPFPTHFA